MQKKYLYFTFFFIFIVLLFSILYLTFFKNTENFADNQDENDQQNNKNTDIPKIDVQESDTPQSDTKQNDIDININNTNKAPLRVLDDTERKMYEKELGTDIDYKKPNLNYDKVYEGGREIESSEINKDKENIKTLPLEKDLQNRQLYKDPNENLNDTPKVTSDLIDIDEDLTNKDKGDLEYPKKENIVKYDFFKCNLDVDAESETEPVIDKKKYPCNASIHERYMFGCKTGNPFPTELQQSVGSNYDNILEDPSNFYKKINRPIIGAVDNFDWNPYNMVDYSNTANYFDIGKIPLDKNKVIPVQYNYVFKNSPSFSFI